MSVLEGMANLRTAYTILWSLIPICTTPYQFRILFATKKDLEDFCRRKSNFEVNQDHETSETCVVGGPGGTKLWDLSLFEQGTMSTINT